MGGNFGDAALLFQRAIRLDPNFAVAYAALGTSLSDVDENSLAFEDTKKAYELRERVSEREKFYIDLHYHLLATGNLEKALRDAELWRQTYLRDEAPPHNMSVIYSTLGEYDNALTTGREALQLDPESGLDYAIVCISYLSLNRLEEAQATAEEAQKKNLDSADLRWDLYFLAFVQNDVAAMAQHMAWVAGLPGGREYGAALESDTYAYFGRLAKARALSDQAVAGILRFELKEAAAGAAADASLREALFGNIKEARQRAAATLRLSKGRDSEYQAAFAFALAGDSAQAQTLAKDLATRFPEDTVVQGNYLPTIDAQLSLNRRDFAKAIELLQIAVPYEMGSLGSHHIVCLHPAYVRGTAYLASRQAELAAAEFQKIVEHPSIVLNEPMGALAHLQLGRAYALQGDTAKALAAYQHFLTLWKDADPDIPLLKQAKSEYAKLQN